MGVDHTDGLWGQWRQGAFVIRSLAHLAVAVESTSGRSVRRRAALLVASVAFDAWVANRTRTTRHRSIPETLTGVFDVAAWTAMTRANPIHLRALSFASVAPNLMETGFRLRAGTSAVPVIEPALRWRPPLTRLAGSLVRDAAPTLGAMVAVRSRRGLPTGFGPLGWAVVGAWGGFALARVRDRAQHDTTKVWEARTASLIESARVRSRVQSALVHNTTAVDPKAMLTFLERSGSLTAGRQLDTIAKSTTVAAPGSTELGVTLAAAVDLREVRPSHYRTRWVSRAQVREIRDAMARIDHACEPLGDAAPPDDSVTIISADTAMLILSYRGRRIEAAQPTPDLAIRLEPTVWPIVASAVLSAITALPSNDDQAHPRAVVAALGLHAVALVRLVRTPPMERRADRTTALLSLAAALVMDISIGLNRSAPALDEISGERIEESAGTTATQSVMFLLGVSWQDLSAEAPFLLSAAIAGWLFSLRLHHGRSWQSVVAEACFLVMPLLANLGTGTRTRAEAELLDAVLQERLSATITDAARIEARTEIDRFIAQLDCVITELPHLHPSLTDDEVTEIVATYRAERTRFANSDPLALIGW